MNPITLPTSPETRAALEKAGWYLQNPRLTRIERWCHDDPNADAVLYHNADSPRSGNDCNLVKLLEFAAILGIHPEGHRIVAAKTLLRAHQICDMHVNLAQVVAKVDVSCLVKDTKTALAVALGVAPPPPRPSVDGGLSPSPLAAAEEETDLLTRLQTVKTMPELDAMRTEVVQAIHAGGTEEAFDRLQGAFVAAKNRLQRIPLSERTW